MSLNREDGPRTRLKGRLKEGTGKVALEPESRTYHGVSFHAPSPLTDRTLQKVTEAAQAANKGGTVRNRPLPMEVGRGRFYHYEQKTER